MLGGSNRTGPMTQDSTSQPRKPNARSAAVTHGPNRAAARSYLRAAGMRDEDFEKPMIAKTCGTVNIKFVFVSPKRYGDKRDELQSVATEGTLSNMRTTDCESGNKPHEECFWLNSTATNTFVVEYS